MGQAQINEEEVIARRHEIFTRAIHQQQKFRHLRNVLTGGVALSGIVAGVALARLPEFNQAFKGFPDFGVSLLLGALTFGAACGSGLIFMYLQGMLMPLHEEHVWRMAEIRARRELNELAGDSSQTGRALDRRLDEMDARISGMHSLVITNDHGIAAPEIAKHVLSSLTPDVGQAILNDLREDLIAENRVSEMLRITEASTSHLHGALAQLTRRANINLGVGSGIAGVGLVAFFVLMFNSHLHPEDPLDFVANFIPRVTLIVAIELFAYFFLSLYKANLGESKYYHNELTNLQTWHLALKVTLSHGDQKDLSVLSERLCSIDRNVYLSQGQTTVELESAKLDSRVATAMARQIDSLAGLRKILETPSASK